jgi:hypothetical protein
MHGEEASMAKLTAKGSTCPQSLQKTLTLCRRDYQKRYDEWQQTWLGFKDRIHEPQRARLKALGATLWRFDLRFRWAIGVTSLEFDDRIVTQASTGATRQGYWLLMRLVDLWFSVDLAFALYEPVLVSNHVSHPSVLETVRRHLRKRLRVLRSAEQVGQQTLKQRFLRAPQRERFVSYLEDLARDSGDTVAGAWTGELAGCVHHQRPVEAHLLLAAAQAIRNRYVHGGETASTRGFPAQEKAPWLRLLTGTTQVTCLALATVATEELIKRLRRQVGIR